MPISAAISLQKGSEFLHQFNYNLEKLLERGIIHKLNADWSKKKVVNYEAPPAMSLGYDNLLFPFVIIVGGTGIAGNLNYMIHFTVGSHSDKYKIARL